MAAPTIIWFRRDLRVHDHAPLSEAAQRGGPMVPLLTLDPALNPPPETGASRVAFLLTSLRALDRDLRRRDARLMVLRGDPASLLGAVARRLRPEAVVAHSNSERVLGRVRDACASQQLRNQGVRMRWFDPPASTDELLR